MSETFIHPSAIVDPKAQLDTGVEVGPFCVIGPDVKVGKNSKLYSHVTLDGIVEMGENNQIWNYTNIGNPPQDLSYQGEPTKVVIGSNNIFREFNSIQRGTVKDNGITRIGDNCYFMGYVHVAHDCQLGSNILLINSVQFAGHVKVGDYARISGYTKVTQFVTIGRRAFIGGDSTIDRDIPHFCTAYGNRARMKGINIIGLKRAGYSKQSITEVVDFYRTMEASALSPRSFVKNEELMEEYKGNEIVDEIVAFIDKSDIGIAPFWD